MSQYGDQSNKCFVGQVPGTTTEEEMREVFGAYGTVTDVMFLKNKLTGQHRGCAFVTFTSAEEANAAIAGLHDQHTLPGAKRTLIIRIAGQNKTDSGNEHKLYVAMLSRSTTVEELRTMFESYGNVTDSFIMHEKGDPAKSRGCGFVKYETREECLRAVSALHGKIRDKDAPQMIQVRFAHTKMEKDQFQNPMRNFMGMGSMGMGMGMTGDMGMNSWQGYPPASDPYGNFGMQSGFMGDQSYGMQGMGGGYGGMGYGAAPAARTQQAKGPPGANLFVYGIPDSYKDADLASLFQNFGTIVSAKVQVDLQTQRSKGFGFVSFDSVASAQSAISHMDNFILQGKKLNVRVKKGAGEQAAGGQTQRYTPY